MAHLNVPRTLLNAVRHLWGGASSRESTLLEVDVGVEDGADSTDRNRYRSGSSEFELYELSPGHFTLRRRHMSTAKKD